jgi:hypothetical protein
MRTRVNATTASAKARSPRVWLVAAIKGTGLDEIAIRASAIDDKASVAIVSGRILRIAEFLCVECERKEDSKKKKLLHVSQTIAQLLFISTDNGFWVIAPPKSSR